MFITLEGIDGCGKSTLSKQLHKIFPNSILTLEPYKMKDFYHLPTEDVYDVIYKDRAAHIEDVILPALADGKTVISDRYYHSTLAYQPITHVLKNSSEYTFQYLLKTQKHYHL